MEALKAALREGRPVAVFYDRGQIRFVVEGQDRQMAEYALPVSAGPLGGAG